MQKFQYDDNPKALKLKSFEKNKEWFCPDSQDSIQTNRLGSNSTLNVIQKARATKVIIRLLHQTKRTLRKRNRTVKQWNRSSYTYLHIKKIYWLKNSPNRLNFIRFSPKYSRFGPSTYSQSLNTSLRNASLEGPMWIQKNLSTIARNRYWWFIALQNVEKRTRVNMQDVCVGGWP